MFSEKLLLRLKHASTVTVLTGAGISAESGLPTFRGKDGIWHDHKVEELATLSGFKKDPELFWEFYNWRRQNLRTVEPNLGHYALVDFERFYNEFSLITQNVDNLHQLAGSKNIVELHGNILNLLCTGCGHKETIDLQEDPGVPKCAKCSSVMRPDVILFGENLNPDRLREAQEKSATCEVFFSIGTSGLVEPAASLPYMAKGNGGYLVEINTEETNLTPFVDESIRGESGTILPQLVMTIERIM